MTPDDFERIAPRLVRLAWLALVVPLAATAVRLVWMQREWGVLWATAQGIADPELTVVAALVVAVAALVGGSQASSVARAGAVVCWLQAGIATGLAAWSASTEGLGWFAPFGGTAGRVLALVVLGFALWVLGAKASEVGAAVAVVPETVDELTNPTVASGQKLQPASWSADEAAGAVWTRAGDAASGGAPSAQVESGAGRDDRMPSWTPVPREDVQG